MNVIELTNDQLMMIDFSEYERKAFLKSIRGRDPILYEQRQLSVLDVRKWNAYFLKTQAHTDEAQLTWLRYCRTALPLSEHFSIWPVPNFSKMGKILAGFHSSSNAFTRLCRQAPLRFYATFQQHKRSDVFTRLQKISSQYNIFEEPKK